jgi:ferredoxin/flavodoxin---NADP+ reductase
MGVERSGNATSQRTSARLPVLRSPAKRFLCPTFSGTPLMGNPATDYNATVIAREEINPLLVILRVQPDGPLFTFRPGQFAVLGLLGGEPRVPEAMPDEPAAPPDKIIRRAYSLASSSLEQGYAEFYITLVSSGALTPRLFALRPGARVFMSPKATGVFTPDRVAADKALLLIATGTGLAPYMSMLRTLLVADDKRRFVVLHGARCSWDLGYRAELESLARIRPNFTYIPSITRPESDPAFRGVTGRIQNLVATGVVEKTAGLNLDPAAMDVFLCGNPDMISAVKAILLERGFVPDHGKQIGTIHVEEYW